MPGQPTLGGLDLQTHLQDPLRKQEYVTTVFDIVAPSYDWFTRFSSLGLDMSWKRELLRLVRAQIEPDARVLDLATGTGDLVFSLAPFLRHGHVAGLDICRGMIERAVDLQERRKVKNAQFLLGDMMHLPFPSASMNAVTVSYGLRNCPDFRLALREIHRVLKPGGCLACLDFFRSAHVLWERWFCQSLLLTCNFFGWLWHGQPGAYGYLAHSIAHFISIQHFSQTLADEGFTVLAQRPKLAGMVCIHWRRNKIGRSATSGILLSQGYWR